MSDQQACQTPIIDLLRDIPADARMVYEVTSTHHQSIPVGVLAKKAADEIERLTARLEIDQSHSVDGIEARDATIKAQDKEIERLRQLLCKCNMRTRMVGDGCEFCNPQLAEELAKEQL